MKDLPFGTPSSRQPRGPFLVLVGVLAVLLFAACSPADANGGNPDPDPDPDPDPNPTVVKPSASAVLALDESFDFAYMPGEPVDDLEWDIEIEYDTTDVEAVFAHYDSVLLGLGFAQEDIERDEDEIEAEYRNADGVWIEIEVERDGSNVDVDMDVEDPRTYPDGSVLEPFSLTEFQEWTIPVYPDAAVRDVEWDFNFDHPETPAQDVFDHYDQALQDMGWIQTAIDDDDDDEWEADYRMDGVHIELEVEDDDEGTEVEIELNKLRFYQGQS